MVPGLQVSELEVVFVLSEEGEVSQKKGAAEIMCEEQTATSIPCCPVLFGVKKKSLGINFTQTLEIVED